MAGISRCLPNHCMGIVYGWPENRPPPKNRPDRGVRNGLVRCWKLTVRWSVVFITIEKYSVGCWFTKNNFKLTELTDIYNFIYVYIPSSWAPPNFTLSSLITHQLSALLFSFFWSTKTSHCSDSLPTLGEKTKQFE